MRKRLLTAGLTCVILIAGCSSNDGGNSSTLSSDDSMYEITEESSNDSTSESDFVSAFETSEYSSEAISSSSSNLGASGGTTVDVKDYTDKLTSEYGGNLEQELAKALNTTAVDSTDDAGSCFSLCDGAIEILGSADGTGFFVTQLKETDNFSIFGASVGMSSEEAVKALIDNGLKENSGEYSTYYAINPEDFYVELKEEGGKVTEVKYTNCQLSGR